MKPNRVLHVLAVLAVVCSLTAAVSLPSHAHPKIHASHHKKHATHAHKSAHRHASSNPVASAASSLKKTQEHVEAIKKVVAQEAMPVQQPNIKQRKPYRGHLDTRAVNGSLICESPECSMAAALIIDNMDVTVNPCEDFFMYACGGFIAANPAPPESGTFDAASDLLGTRLDLLLNTPAEASDPPPLFMLRRSYDACRDLDTMDSLGVEPLYNEILAIGGWPMVDPSWEESSYSTEASLASLRDLNIVPMFGMAIGSDLFNTSQFIMYIGEGSSSISEAALAAPNLFAGIITAYKTYITDSAKQVRDYLASAVTDAEIEAEVEDLVAFETELAQLMEASFASNVTDVVHKMTVAEAQAVFDTETPGQFDLLEYIRLVFEPSSTIIAEDDLVYLEDGPAFITGLSTLLSNTNKRTLANYMAWQWTLDIGSETTYAMRNISGNFYEAYLGFSPYGNREAYCRIESNANLGFVLSRAYIDDFFPDGAKEENEEMVEDIRSSFDAILDGNDWMAPEDLVTAKEKLAAVESFVAYPDWIADDAAFTAAYEGLVIGSDTQFDNLVAIGRYNELYETSIYRDEPHSTFIYPPTVVNAFYDPTHNSITILAGILQIPFYQHNSLAALNYGGIGMVIGHELTHGFDDSGRNFDKDGNLARWWGQESIDAFNERAQCFVDQYDNFYPPEVDDPTVHVDGQYTLGENIADNGGIREAFAAYQRYVSRVGEEPRLPGLDEFSPDQLFYLGNANLWCESRSSESIQSQLVSDVHSPGRFRILGPLSNDAEFSQVWNCPADSAMNRGDEACVLW